MKVKPAFIQARERLTGLAAHLHPASSASRQPVRSMLSSPERNMETQAWAKQQRDRYKSTLQSFTSSNDDFQNLYVASKSGSDGEPPSSSSPLKHLTTLYVLDSSFNPPTKAHLTLARNALLHDHGTQKAGSYRMLFLLATINADKPTKPAPFEDRLVMMSLLANQLAAEFSDQDLEVDVGVTKKPFYMDKAVAIDDAGVYGGAQQVHITGYDTIVRIFNAKYYPEESGLRVLEPFLGKHRLRVCYRIGDDEAKDRAEQDQYVEGIGNGRREDEGMKKEWRKHVELVDDAAEVKGVSSTKVRQAAVDRRKQDLEPILGKDIAEYVWSSELYTDAESVKKPGVVQPRK